MQKDELTALAERVQALTGPCRETDALICGTDRATAMWHSHDETPAYTASLDAAMTLVPPASNWSVQYSDLTSAEAWIFPPNNEALVQFYAAAATPALALTAAALLALAEQVQQ